LLAERFEKWIGKKRADRKEKRERKKEGNEDGSKEGTKDRGTPSAHAVTRTVSTRRTITRAAMTTAIMSAYSSAALMDCSVLHHRERPRRPPQVRPHPFLRTQVRSHLSPAKCGLPLNLTQANDCLMM
jgi:hypothetical protein